MFGFINCNKPIGFSSRDVVNVVQGQLRGRKMKVGHCGTLDPLAEGVLVVAIGQASKLVPFVHETSKRYVGKFRLGSESPTGDLEVEPTVDPDALRPTLQQLQRGCVALTGQIEQTPPAFSAIKINGKRAYDLARKGKEVEVPSRTVRIDSLEVTQYDYPDIVLDITCSTGTYIRTLGMDLAKAVGTCAVMTWLQRTNVGPFDLSEAVDIETIRKVDLEDLVQPATLGTQHLPQLTIDEDDRQKLEQGKCLGEEHGRQPDSTITQAAAVLDGGELKAIVKWRDGRWWPKKVFCVGS